MADWWLISFCAVIIRNLTNLLVNYIVSYKVILIVLYCMLFSPLSYPAVNRYSSSSLSSQASNEVSNITGQSESSDEVFNMQVSAQGRRWKTTLIHTPADPSILSRRLSYFLLISLFFSCSFSLLLFFFHNCPLSVFICLSQIPLNPSCLALPFFSLWESDLYVWIINWMDRSFKFFLLSQTEWLFYNLLIL